MAVCRTEAFRDDTFAPKGAGVPEDDFPVAVEMLVKGDAIIRAAEEIGQRVLTILKACPSDILAIEFDEIEGAQYSGVVVKPMAESFEYREAGFVDHDCLAVDDTGTDRQARDRIDDLRKARREIVAVASEEPHGIRLSPRNDTKTVVLYLVNPTGPSGRLLGRPR